MKVFIYSTNFYPEQTGIGKYSGEMAFWLGKQGHDVRVICSAPHYPNWRVEEGYSASKYTKHIENGVKIYRAPIWIPKHPGGISRLIHTVSFSLSSLPIALSFIFWKPDVIFTVAPSLACAPTALLVAKMSSSKSWLHIQDFEVDVAFKMGLLKGKIVRSIALWLESSLLGKYDVVSTISHRMKDRLIKKGVVCNKTRLFPNWVDISKISVLVGESPYRGELGIEGNQRVVLFSGSLGSKQGLMVIPDAARRLRHRQDILFVICGDGVMRPAIENASKDLPNVKLLPLQPIERLNDLLGLADVHILPQSPEAEDLVLPSKLSGMLASGRPIIATCRPDTEIAKMVSKCGIVSPPEDPVALADAILAILEQDEHARTALGASARKQAEEFFSQESILLRFASQLQGEDYVPAPGGSRRNKIW